MKRQLPLVLVFVFGMTMVIQYFIPHRASEWVYEFLLDWIIIIGIFALALGIWSLVHVSVDKIRSRKANWQYSILTLVTLFLMVLFGWTAKVDDSWGFHFYTAEGLENPAFVSFFDFIMIPIMSTMFALLAFFISSASYRAFRARNILATLLLLAALIVMLRFTPGPWGDLLSRTSSWLMNVPNLAAQRAIVIGIGLGIVSTALKVVLGIERGYMGKG
jgi:hypothetical protein